MQFDEILAHFQIQKRYGDRAQARCPCHDDRQASLTITKGRRSALIYCHAGCNFEDIIQKAGLKKHNLYFEERPPGSGWRAYVEGREKKRIEAVYNYFSSINGEYTFTKIRMQDKRMIYGVLCNDCFTYGLGGKHRKDLKSVYGELKALNKAIAEGRPVFIPEGEKDVDTLTKRGYAAITYGGVNDWQFEFATLFKGAEVYILADNDEPGRKVANTILSDLKGIAKSAKVIVPVPDIPKADISDFFAAGHSNEDFEKLLQSAVTGNESNPAPVMTVPKGTPLVNQLVKLDAAKRFATNDKGSAELFSTVFKNVSRYNPTQKDWMYYNGIKWIADTEGMKAKRNAKKLADAILSYAVNVSGLDEKQRESYLKYASRLMNYRDRNTMVNDAKDLNFFENTELDKDDLILNLKNCVLDLSGDIPKILEHNADLLLSKCCNASYDPHATCKLWEKTINEIMEDNTEKIRYLQKILGLCLTGITAEEELYFFYGASTRNGKSTICETVLSILNDYGATISPETLAVKANKDSRTASPDIAKLAGIRLVIASEPPKKMIFDTSLVKTLTGRDRVTARFLHQNEFFFTPKFKLLINTNYLPTITDQTVFKSSRIRVVSFNKHFGEHEQNKKLKDELRKEADGILNWMIRGLYLYRKEGLEPPTAVRDSTEEYEADSDKIGRFISECLVKSDKNTSAKDVYETYSKWCSDSGLGVDGRNNFYIELKTRGLFGASGTVNGKTVRNIVRGYVLADEEFMSVDENEPLPFD